MESPVLCQLFPLFIIGNMFLIPYLRYFERHSTEHDGYCSFFSGIIVIVILCFYQSFCIIKSQRTFSIVGSICSYLDKRHFGIQHSSLIGKHPLFLRISPRRLGRKPGRSFMHMDICLFLSGNILFTYLQLLGMDGVGSNYYSYRYAG
jgi:hypothetical protein